jgi:hypothetical protein
MCILYPVILLVLILVHFLLLELDFLVVEFPKVDWLLLVFRRRFFGFLLLQLILHL